MSAKEILDKLKVEAHDELIPELDAQIAASAEVIDLKVFSGISNSLYLVGQGRRIYAVFQNGPSGGGSSHRYLNGSGSFAGGDTPAGITGKYRLVVRAATAQLFDQNNRLVWFGTGRQNGLTGEYWVDF